MHDWHVLSPTVAVHLPMTLRGGQCFRWQRTARGTWVGVVGRGAYELCGAAQPPPGARSMSPSRGDSFKDALWFRCLHRELKTVSDVALEAAFLRYYLALDVDLRQLWQRWTVDNPMREHPLVRYFALNVNREPSINIRVLRQEVHETLLAFICSQNNNVQRITGLIEKMAINCGTHICDYNLVTGDVRGFGSVDHGAKKKQRHKRQLNQEEGEWISLHSLPTMEELGRKKEDDLRALGFGYRSKYIIDCASMIQLTGATKRPRMVGMNDSVVCSYKWYDDLLDPRLTLCERRKKLLSLPGVGRKVSDCILLFALGHHELVPVDTHMAQVAAEYLTQPAVKKTEDRLSAGKGGSRKRVREGTACLKETRMDGLWWEEVLADWYRKGKERDMNMPALLPKHHDAIQLAFQNLFGDWCGWAHSILFYGRIRTKKQKT